jgi:transposase-like protein
MAQQANRVLWDQWRQRIDRQRVSGLSIAEFCRRERLSPPGFYVWRRKLRATTSAQPEAIMARRLRKRPQDSMPRRRPRPSRADLLGPDRVPGFLQLPVTAMRPSPWIELALADGTILRLPQQNVATLLAVLRMLRGESEEWSSAEHGHA